MEKKIPHMIWRALKKYIPRGIGEHIGKKSTCEHGKKILPNLQSLKKYH